MGRRAQPWLPARAAWPGADGCPYRRDRRGAAVRTVPGPARTGRDPRRCLRRVPPRRLMPAFTGAILTGGASTRMGRDKATDVEVDGRPLVRCVADALVAAGADEVLAIGGDAGKLAAAGLDVVPDAHPGEGPLGGILTALRRARNDTVVVLSCDLAWLDAATVARLLEVDTNAPVVARTDRRQPLIARWSRAHTAAL